MPQHKSAEKRVRQNIKRRARNNFYFLNIFISNVRIILIITIDVIGIKILVRSVSMRMSPGNLPNQFISQGA